MELNFVDKQRSALDLYVEILEVITRHTSLVSNVGMIGLEYISTTMLVVYPCKLCTGIVTFANRLLLL